MCVFYTYHIPLSSTPDSRVTRIGIGIRLVICDHGLLFMIPNNTNFMYAPDIRSTRVKLWHYDVMLVSQAIPDIISYVKCVYTKALKLEAISRTYFVHLQSLKASRLQVSRGCLPRNVIAAPQAVNTPLRKLDGAFPSLPYSYIHVYKYVELSS